MTGDSGFVAGEPRTGFVLAAALALLAQWGAAVPATPAGATALALHAVAAGLVYLVFVNLTKRRLGAPMIGAALWGAHPAHAATLAAAEGPCAAGGAALAFLAVILLARTPLDRRLLVPSLAAYAAAVPFAPAAAAAPVLVAAAICAYHGLEPSRLFTRRLLPRFAAFLVPLGAWIAWSWTSGGAPRPAFGAAPAILGAAVLPLSAWPDTGQAAGITAVAVLLVAGLARLRKEPKVAWPLAACGASLAAAALVPSAVDGPPAAAVPLAALALLAGEGVEQLFFAFGGAVAMPLLAVVYAALAVLSHRAAG